MVILYVFYCRYCISIWLWAFSQVVLLCWKQRKSDAWICGAPIFSHCYRWLYFCALIWRNSTCLNKATGWSYQNRLVVAPCEVGRWGCFVFLVLVDFGGGFLQHHCFSFRLLDIFSQVVEMVFHDPADGISKASSLSSWVCRNYTLQYD